LGELVSRVTLETPDGQTVEFADGIVGAPYAARVRAGQVKTIHVHAEAQK
jgi:hypothetical protein